MNGIMPEKRQTSCGNEPRQAIKKCRGVGSRCVWWCWVPKVGRIYIETENNLIVKFEASTRSRTFLGEPTSEALKWINQNNGNSQCVEARLA